MKNSDFSETKSYIRKLMLEESNTETKLIANKIRCNKMLKLMIKYSEIGIEEYEFLTNLIEEYYKNQIFNIAVSNFIDTYTLEAVNHFLNCKSERYISDHPRYFMNVDELSIFLELFKSHGGMKDMVHISTVLTDSGDFLSYEVVSKEVWDNPKLRARACYCYQN